MGNNELLKFKEVKRWVAGKPKGTITQYLCSLRVYCDYRGMNPKQLIDEIEEDRKKPRRERGEVEYKLKEFYSWLLNDKKKEVGGLIKKTTGEKGVSPKRATSIIGAIRGFYKDNGFPILLKLPRATTLKKNHKKQIRAEDVKKLVDHAPTIRDKAIILMLFQSGMDVSTLCSLDYGDVAKGLERDEYPLPIHVVRKKAGIEYTTFLGRDGIEALKAYINKRRERQGEIKHTEPLFVKERNRNENKRITRELIEKVLREVAVLSGVVSKEEMERADMNPCRPHALRGAFSTIMKLQGVNNEIVEYWMGHVIPYEAAYMIPQEEELKRIYAEHEEALSINRATEQVKKLEQKFNGKMETYDEIINRQAAEIKKLREKLAEMEQSKDKQLGEMLIRALENNPDLLEQIGELLAKKVEDKKTS
ncbi:integrase [candidate division TA06 bacterium]|uniref:Integrase n=1 Tax=candidate division TA06 bacterium TaxID=2250710 RepID=A0A660SBQ3_UNCT6|nr:MAG: integrase [candidate division TA06 bacterium]